VTTLWSSTTRHLVGAICPASYVPAPRSRRNTAY